MTKYIQVRHCNFILNNIGRKSFDQYEKDNVRKLITEGVTIGRDESNDISYNYAFLSRNHGRIFVEKGGIFHSS
jgi:pSer/pThr/pTyr-binding forkhead associated (FHA) protein